LALGFWLLAFGSWLLALGSSTFSKCMVDPCACTFASIYLSAGSFPKIRVPSR
jgi:hypothetical protein